MSSAEVSIVSHLADYKSGKLTGKSLADMMGRGEITKAQRRKIVKLSAKEAHKKELTERQKIRLATKEKKSLPKLSADKRREKFGTQKLTELDKEREKERANFMTCLGCRKRGHILKDCPRALTKDPNAPAAATLCFNCGATDHALRHCPQPRNPDGSLPFSTCFICKQIGHIARDCSENPNGLYPKGGCCHICLQKTHLAKDCPERTEEDIKKHEEDKDKRKHEQGKKRGSNNDDGDDAPRIGSTSDNNKGGDEDDFDVDTFNKGAGGSDDEDDNDAPAKKRAKKEKKAGKKDKKDKKDKNKSKDH